MIGLWAVLPPYVGPALRPLETRKEIADHVVPAVLILVVSGAAWLALRRGTAPSATAMLLGGLAIALAGLWMTATHVPLVAQALRHEPGAPWPATVWHSTPGVVVAALGLWWSVAYWADAGTQEVPVERGGPARGRTD